MDFFTHSICQNYSASQWIFGQNWIFKKSIEIIFGHLEAEFGCTNRTCENRTFYIAKIEHFTSRKSAASDCKFCFRNDLIDFCAAGNAWHGSKLIFLFVTIEFHLLVSDPSLKVRFKRLMRWIFSHIRFVKIIQPVNGFLGKIEFAKNPSKFYLAI